MKNGFTLVELITIFFILGLILIIAIPKITETLENAKNKTYEVEKNNIEKAAAIYVNENASLFRNEDSFQITLNTLCDGNYIVCPIYDSYTKEELNGVINVTRTSDDTFSYNFVRE